MSRRIMRKLAFKVPVALARPGSARIDNVGEMDGSLKS